MTESDDESLRKQRFKLATTCTRGGSMRMSRNILPKPRAETERSSLHSHATPGAMHPSPTQEACLYFLVEMKLVCVCEICNANTKYDYTK